MNGPDVPDRPELVAEAVTRLAGPALPGEYVSRTLFRMVALLDRNTAGGLLSALVGRMLLQNDRDEAATAILLTKTLNAIASDLRDQGRRS